jgi:DNA-directed RNA polymerase subunit RPC12/RpoP
MPNRLTLDYIKEYSNKVGYRLISTSYINQKTPLEFVCPKGHTRKSSWASFVRNPHGCRKCLAEKSRVGLEKVKELFFDSNYMLLSEEYIRAADRLKYKCDRGHINYISLNNFNRGKRCPDCYKEDVYYNIDIVENMFLGRNLLLLEHVYKNTYTKMEYMCTRCGKRGITTVNALKNNSGCSSCNNTVLEEGIVRRELGKKGFKLIDGTYTMAKKSFLYICDKGHIEEGFLYNIRRGNGCGVCYNYGGNRVSKQENDLFDELRGYIKNEVIIRNDRTAIKPYELDMYVPDFGVAVEYCGMYWHSVSSGKTKQYHRGKYKLCEDNNIRLITVTDDDIRFNKKEVLSKILKHFLVIEKEKNIKIVNRDCDRGLVDDLIHVYGNENVACLLFKKVGSCLHINDIVYTNNKNMCYLNSLLRSFISEHGSEDILFIQDNRYPLSKYEYRALIDNGFLEVAITDAMVIESNQPHVMYDCAKTIFSFYNKYAKLCLFA